MSNASISKPAAELNIEGRYKQPLPIYEAQAMAPAPSQTYYHLALYPICNNVPHPISSCNSSSVPKKKGTCSTDPDYEKHINEMKLSGCMVLQDWPRKRLSQNWTRGGLINPSQKIYSFKEIMDGELEEQIIFIFGKEVYRKILKLIKNENSDEVTPEEKLKTK